MVKHPSLSHLLAPGVLVRILVLLLATVGVGPTHASPPPVTPEERAAAFPVLAHADMASHMNDDPVRWMVLFDQLEWQNREVDAVLRWDVRAWIGGDMHRLLVRAEGDRTAGDTRENRLELLWQHPFASWWDLVAGLRQDFGPGPGRTFAALGVQGVAPYRLRVEATAYAGERGQTGARLQLEHELLVTNRLILSPRIEADAWGSEDLATGTGRGLSEMKAGVRLRYEVRREFAPYIGVEWARKYGTTADLARGADEPVGDARLVAGARLWF